MVLPRWVKRAGQKVGHYFSKAAWDRADKRYHRLLPRGTPLRGIDQEKPSQAYPRAGRINFLFFSPKEGDKLMQHSPRGFSRELSPHDIVKNHGPSIRQQTGTKNYRVIKGDYADEADFNEEYAHARQIVFHHEKRMPIEIWSDLGITEEGMFLHLSERGTFQKYGFTTKRSFLKGLVRLFRSPYTRRLLMEVNRLKRDHSGVETPRARVIYDELSDRLRKEARREKALTARNLRP